MKGEILIQNISKSYPGGKVALKPTSVTIPADKAVGLIGENGSGKSTFLKLLAGFLSPDSGSVLFNDLSPFYEATKFRKELGYLSQDVQLDPEMTGYESLALFATFYGINGSKKQQRIGQLKTEFNLEDHLHKTIKSYSGGLRQRLHLAISLIHDPAFLLMDEPTNALDASGKKMLWQQIRKRSELGRATIVVSHDLYDIERTCDHLLFFHQGKVVLKGATKKLVEQDNSHRLIYFIDGKIDQDQLRSEITLLKGIRRMDISKDQILFSIDNQYEGIDLQLQEILQQQGLQILESRKRKTDLSTLYFNITGQTEEQKQKGNRKNKRGKR